MVEVIYLGLRVYFLEWEEGYRGSDILIKEGIKH